MRPPLYLFSPAARERGDVFESRLVADGPVDGLVAAEAVSAGWVEDGFE
jgi:hypothetical protein